MEKTIHSDKQAKLCELLRQARDAKELSQAKLAEKLKVPQSWVAKVELGERRLDVVEFDKLARVLEIDIPRFFSELRKK